jgi:predicted nucleic acid-binding protein
LTAIVVDASVLVRVLVQSGTDGDRARATVSGHDLAAPELIDLEVASAIRRLVSTSAVSAGVAGRALDLLSTAPVTRYPHLPLVARAWELRENLTVYDAAYAALAELLDVTLVTADRGLASAPGPRCPRQHLP